MNDRGPRSPIASESGFTLIEIMVVALIVGILTATAVPQYYKSIERAKTTEVLNSMNSLRGAQERYRAKYGTYCIAAISAGVPGCAGFDSRIPDFKHFTPLAAFAGGAATWTGAVTRLASPAVYGAYTITYTVNNGGPATISCSQADCQTDLIR